jgi:hypothetical protein
MIRSFSKFVCCLSIALSLSAVAFAQTITGSVSGTVTDPSGAVIKGAKVIVTNVDTGVAVSDTTNAAGIYNVRFLQIGKYKVLTEAKGFTKQSFGPFTLEINQTAKVDLKLSVGGDSSKVEVSSISVPLLDTEDSTIATTLSSNTIENIPMNGHNFSSLSLYTPGAVSTSPTGLSGTNAYERNTGSSGQVSTNGNRLQTNNYRLDGMEINETLNNLIGYNPNPDALAQVQIISANAPAEYGNVTGGDTIAVTKSGTNQYHGSLAAFLMDYKLDANTWANKNFPSGTAFSPRNPYTETFYSATLGGPIRIPHLFNGKDKLFFFVDYFAARYHQGGVATSTVLSAKMRQGDFSELLNPAIMCSSTGGVCADQRSLIQLYDPTNNFAPYTGNLNVPINNPVARYLIAHPEIYPLPNLNPGTNSPVSNNYRGAQQKGNYNNQGDVKIDWTPTDKDRISVRYLQGEAGDKQVNPIAVTFPGSSVYPDKGLALNWVRTITPSIINEARAGYTRIRWSQSNPTDTTGQFGLAGNAKVGIPGTQAFQGFSAQSISSFTTVGTTAGGTNFIDNSFLYGDNLTWQHGKHLVKVGAQFLRYQQNNFYPGNDGALGQFQYNGNFTNNPTVLTTNSNLAPSGAGYGGADFVLDRVYFEGVGGVAGRTGQRQWRSGYFIQDDWKIRPNLTLNIGLRYEYFQPIYEVNNKTANVNLATGTVQYAGSIPASNTVAGATVCPNRACYNATYNNFMPRVGFAYSATPKLVIRGGFGTTKELEGTGANLRLTYNPPFQPSLELTGTPYSATSAGQFFRVENGFSTSANPNYSGTTYRAWAANLQPQVTNEYSLTTEYQINNFSSFKLSYVGESSSHLIQAVAANQLVTPCILNGVIQSNPNSTACTAADPAPYKTLVGQSGAVVETATEGEANYNALQVQYRQRTTKGLEFTVNYAYAHAFTNTCGFFCVPSISGPSAYAQNAYDNHSEYGPAGQDVRNNVNGTLVYALPFGKGKDYGANINGLLDAVAGGWKVAMTGIAYSGFPVTINAANNNAYTNNKAQRPNQATNTHFKTHTLANWWGGSNITDIFNKYTQPAAGTYGNAHVGSERGPGYQQYDLSLFKDFRIVEGQRIGFRMDAFNVFNMTSLGNPGNSQSPTLNSNGTISGGFGQITSVRSPQRQLQFSAKYQF